MIKRITENEIPEGVEVIKKSFLTVAEEYSRQREHFFRDNIFGLLDCSAVLFFFLPFFGQKTDVGVQAVSLLYLNGISPWLKAAYIAAVTLIALFGIVTLVLQNCRQSFWIRSKSAISLISNAVGVFLFTVSLQPYAAALLFVFLAIKTTMIIKRK